jgi:hypothetical protein
VLHADANAAASTLLDPVRGCSEMIAKISFRIFIYFLYVVKQYGAFSAVINSAG